MGWYPVTLPLQGRPCVVIGGGQIAQRKVEGLLGAGAAVTVISPTLTTGLSALARVRRIRHTRRGYQAGDLTGFFLAFVATDEGSVNGSVAREGRRRGVLVNAADDPAHCDFILPSVLRRGALTVAVATGGATPALARAVREELEDRVGKEYAPLAEVVAQVRRELQARGHRVDATTWRRALDTPLRRLVARGRRAEARRRLLSRLGVS